MRIVIIGAGGHGKVVLDILRAAGEVDPVGFLDADLSLAGTQVCGLTVLGPANLLPGLRRQKVKGAIVAIGENRARDQYAALVREHGLELINAIHPRACVSPTAVLGRNVAVAAHATVCVDARVEDSAIINTAAVVDHENVVGRGSHVGPGALLAGRVRVGPLAFVGMGAKVLQCRTIGEGATVGAGAVVRQDVPPWATVVGVPARVIRESLPPSPESGGRGDFAGKLT
jgi:UDP-perosamine 4-acetyltransferase